MIKKLFSLFSKKEEVKVPTVKPKSAVRNPGVNILKKDLSHLQNHSQKISDELSAIKKQVMALPDHSSIIEKFHAKHESHEKSLAAHTEKFNHFESKLQDHRIDMIELKSKLNELNRVAARVESLSQKIEEIERKAVEIRQTEIVMSPVQKIVKVAKAQPGSLLEQYNSLAPSTKKIFSLLLNMHVEHKGKWIPLSDLRDLAYPDGGNSNSTQAAMAKAIRPLYENSFVEKKRDKSYVYVAASKRGRDAAKEAGLHQQAEKFDAAFAKLEN